MAHDEPPHQDQRCLQIQLVSSLVLKELKMADMACNGILAVFDRPFSITVLSTFSMEKGPYANKW